MADNPFDRASALLVRIARLGSNPRAPLAWSELDAIPIGSPAHLDRVIAQLEETAVFGDYAVVQIGRTFQIRKPPTLKGPRKWMGRRRSP